MRAARLERWEHRIDPFIVIAAILPLIGNLADLDPTRGSWTVELVCWSVFAVDLAVHIRLRPGYLRTRDGMIDLFIVVATFPWSVFVGDKRAWLLALFRLARVARIVVVVRRSAIVRMTFARLGRPAVVLIATLLIGSFVIYRNEPESAGFHDYGDVLWFGIVSVTTVGYGELSATTTASRVASVVTILVGLMFLGAVLATATSVPQSRNQRARGRSEDPDDSEHGDDDPALLRTEVRALRAEVHELHTLIARLTPSSDDGTPLERRGE
ncbi:MAG TPA: ion channel [Acidimicrobiia bacterium]|nr:ion channel [Acidimicrobiia bacterium]